jgi:hypothetical protein
LQHPDSHFSIDYAQRTREWGQILASRRSPAHNVTITKPFQTFATWSRRPHAIAALTIPFLSATSQTRPIQETVVLAKIKSVASFH